jgi:hypothetical protein
MAALAEQRLYLFGIRHHGPGSAALLRQALDAVTPDCVLIEGPPEGDPLIPYVAEAGMKPPVAMLLHASDDASSATFMPFAEFSPEWQAMHWALERQAPVRFIDWPASVSLALSQHADVSADAELNGDEVPQSRTDALDLLAEGAGYDDGEAFWNNLIEQHGGGGQHALAIFASIETAMTEARAHEQGLLREETDHLRDLRREAFMRIQIRAALKEYAGSIAVVAGAWHLGALRNLGKATDDRALIKELPRIKVDATWVPWTDSRLSARSGYGAGVISPGWYRHLWSLYSRPQLASVEEFASLWQARTALTLRKDGHNVPTASAIEAARLTLGLSAIRGLPIPGLAEMREASLATLCHGNPVPLALIEQKLYIGESVGEIDERVPQMPLARDLLLWQRKTRLKPEDVEQELRLDLRSEAGLLKSTLLHRLNLLNVQWGKVLDAQAGRGTFREVWMLRWVPELSVALAEALIYGVTIEQAASNATLTKARSTTSILTLANLVHASLIADLPSAATTCIEQLQAAAVSASDVTDLMRAVAPLVRVLRYGSARILPEDALRALIKSLSIEVNAGVRIGSRGLDEETSSARLEAVDGYDEALRLFGEKSLLISWEIELGHMVNDDHSVPAIAGLSLRKLHDHCVWPLGAVSSAFARYTGDREPAHAGDFLAGFLRGGSEIILHDEPLLHLMDLWLCNLGEEEFIDSLPLLRRSLTGIDAVFRRRLLDKLKRGQEQSGRADLTEELGTNLAFDAALPLLYKILGIGGPV